jgi:chromosome segregation ATPase
MALGPVDSQKKVPEDQVNIASNKGQQSLLPQHSVAIHVSTGNAPPQPSNNPQVIKQESCFGQIWEGLCSVYRSLWSCIGGNAEKPVHEEPTLQSDHDVKELKTNSFAASIQDPTQNDNAVILKKQPSLAKQEKIKIEQEKIDKEMAELNKLADELKKISGEDQKYINAQKLIGYCGAKAERRAEVLQKLKDELESAREAQSRLAKLSPYVKRTPEFVREESYTAWLRNLPRPKVADELDKSINSFEQQVNKMNTDSDERIAIKTAMNERIADLREQLENAKNQPEKLPDIAKHFTNLKQSFTDITKYKKDIFFEKGKSKAHSAKKQALQKAPLEDAKLKPMKYSIVQELKLLQTRVPEINNKNHREYFEKKINEIISEVEDVKELKQLSNLSDAMHNLKGEIGYELAWQ